MGNETSSTTLFKLPTLSEIGNILEEISSEIDQQYLSPSNHRIHSPKLSYNLLISGYCHPFEVDHNLSIPLAIQDIISQYSKQCFMYGIGLNKNKILHPHSSSLTSYTQLTYIQSFCTITSFKDIYINNNHLMIKCWGRP